MHIYISLTEVFCGFHAELPSDLQSSVEYCLEWLSSEPVFPPEGLDFQKEPPDIYTFQVPCKKAKIWLRTRICGPNALNILSGRIE